VGYFGRSGDLALFVFDELGVVVDEGLNLVVEKGHLDALIASGDWNTDDSEYSKAAEDIAQASITDLDIHVFSSNDRLYTIPKSVQSEAKRALEWRKTHKRGGTPVGLNTARTLAEGGQIGIKKIRHIARYFPRHEVDKRGQGYKLGDKGFPSNGRIAWALWGGDAAQKWAATIVERDDKKKKSLTADGLPSEYFEPSSSRFDYFRMAENLPAEEAPEFMARVRLDGSGIDRIYMMDADGIVYIWDDGSWDDLGLFEQDIMSFDAFFDMPDDDVDTMYVPVDAEAAVKICALIDAEPFSPKNTSDFSSDEEMLMVHSALSEIDWDEVDRVLVAAGEAPAADAPADQPQGDGNYTPDERSKNASKQVRDATGKFSKSGSRVVVGNDTNSRGTITSINPDTQTVDVQLDNGNTVTVPGTATQGEDKFVDVSAENETNMTVPPSATAGILGQPRVPSNQPNARIPGMLPPLTGESISLLLNDWPAWVAAERELYRQTAPKTPPNIGPRQYNVPQRDNTGADVRDPSTGGTRNVAWNPMQAPNAYNHPLLRDWLKGSDRHGHPNRGWYNPIVRRNVIEPRRYFSAEVLIAAGAEHPEVQEIKKPDPNAPKAKSGPDFTPETSDVPPMYMAIVAQDDPQAVMDLISLVPVNSQSSTPTIFRREPGEWVKDDAILADLNSPTPPPVVVLDNKNLASVVEQIDQALVASASYLLDRRLADLWISGADVMAIVAAGGVDRNRGNAEKLRRYWTVGEGGAKIRWGTGGDWKRCVRHLSKYLGPRAKGYCNLRHKEMLGIYPATHAKRLRENSMEQPLYMEVPDSDLQMPIEAIHAEEDKNFDHEWEPNEEVVWMLIELKDLDDDTFSLVAAGGLDRNRGNAEELRRYWTVGKGGAKIRWNTKGDWTRCTRHLAKYLGPRAKGYCALRHKEMTGMWTGDQAHRQMYGRKSFSTDFILPEQQIIENAALSAQIASAKARISGVTASGSTPEYGSAFFIPLVIPEQMESGDGRKFTKDAIDMRQLPLPLLWQIKTGAGHDGSVVVGKITHMQRTKDGIGHAFGVFDNGEHGREAERLVRGGFIRGVSADLDRFEASEEPEEASGDDSKKIGSSKINITKARVMAVTLVPKPAFQECTIELIPDMAHKQQEETVVPDGVYVEDSDAAEASALLACGMVAGAIPVTPPKEWFTNPGLSKPTPLTVDEEGRVFGHIAAWHVDHIGMSFGTRPPRSASQYAYFHTGVIRTEEGSDVPVGQLTLAGGHASLEASASEAVRHYDDTASAIADVHAGEDNHGIWVAGALRPGTTPEQVRALRASAPSGDWRPIKGKLELVAVCQVNVPGFPVARARVASGQVLALVAAGANTLAKMKGDPVAELAARIDKLEQLEKAPLVAAAEAAKARIASVRAAELSARVHGTGEFAISEETRMRLAGEGKALPDGSYPIRNVSDLKNAIKSYGRANKSDRAKVRKHITKRAKALGHPELIPDEWTAASILEARVASAMTEEPSAE